MKQLRHSKNLNDNNMPLAPIQQYQDPSNSLMQILQGGNQQIGSILDRAIQIGRDIANKRTQQEQDLAAMRNQETAMVQRRGENLQSVLDTQQKFGMERDKFDFLKMDTQRKYDAQRADQAAQLGHQAWSEQFSQSQADKSAGFTERRLTLEEQAAQQRQAALDAPPIPGVGVASSTTPTPEAPVGNVLNLGRPGTGVSNRTAIGRGLNEMTTPSGGVLAVPATAPSTVSAGDIDILQATREEALKKLATPGITPQQRAENQAVVKRISDQLATIPEAQKPLTESQKIARERLQMAKDKAAQGPTTSLAPIKAQESAASNAAEDIVKGNPEAFANPYTAPPWDTTKNAPRAESKDEKARREALMESWDTNKSDAEAQSALSMERDVYVDKFQKNGLTSDQVSRIRADRRRLWEAARESAAANQRLRGTSATTVPSSLDKYFRPAGS